MVLPLAPMIIWRIHVLIPLAPMIIWRNQVLIPLAQFSHWKESCQQRDMDTVFSGQVNLSGSSARSAPRGE